MRAWLVELVDQVARRLRRHDLKGRTVELKVRFADFRTINRSTTLREPTNTTQELLEAGIELLTKRLPPVICRCGCWDLACLALTPVENHS